MTERKIQVGDIVLNTHVEGRSDAPWVTFCNSLATDLSMYDAQAAALAGDYRILRYDRRGHGGSEAPMGPTTGTRWSTMLLAFGMLSVSRNPIMSVCPWAA